jgi:hypothetical protein
VHDFESALCRRELQNGTDVRIFAAIAAEFHPNWLRVVVPPLFYISAQQYLPANVARRPQLGTDLGRCLTPGHG